MPDVLRGIAAVVALLLGCRPPAPDAPPDAPAIEETDHVARVMVDVPAGAFTMGRDEPRHADEAPAHRVRISAFRIDATLVTVADFRRFVDQTGYVTSAEELGFGMTAVEGMADWEWEKVRGATWRAPWGPARAEAMAQRADEPVVMVSWVDADAYCRHEGKRLPTEAQWEYAMRAGAEGTRYPWGDDPRGGDGAYRLNFWQGRGHEHNEREDGFVYLSPVRQFEPNAWGIYDPVGNVWQWTADWYARDTYATHPPDVLDPTGPASGWARVARGGSWWCSATSCSAYGLFARGKSRPESPFSNNGFRCVSPP